MRCLRISITLLSGVVLLGGCAANDLVVKRQTETDAKVEHLFQTIGGLEARLNELNGRMTSLEEKGAAQQKAMQAVEEQLRGLKEAQQALQTKGQVDQAGTVPKIELVNPDPPAKSRDSGPPAAYVKAFGLYSANNFSAAVTAFEKFIHDSPASDFVPNAWYWIGECHYSSSDLTQALAAFKKVPDGWPRHPKAADALLKIGYSHAALKQPEKARMAFEQVIRSYPGSPAALKARERLMAQ